MRIAVVVSLLVATTVATTVTAQGAPPEPTGAHPRMLLDAKLRADWKASIDRGPVKGSIAMCQSARDTKEHDRAVYQGAEWSKVLQACLVAWAATDQADYAKTAIRLFTALIDDLDTIGDGKGGDNAARRDDGYSIRNLGPFTALAYDWLHAQPGMTPALRQRARERWKAWLDWYREHGYRARVPGTNYQAGYLVSATMISIAQGGEAAEERGPELWKFVTEELWAKDMAAALASGGILDGGDWPEGWQYGPLAVGSYALAMRIARRAGIPVEGVEAWLSSMLRRHVYAMSPAERIYPGGDTEGEQAHLSPHVLTLAAISLGDTTPEDKKWAKGEMSRLKIVDKDYLLYSALATVGDKPELAPREKWPTWYVAPATGTLYARTRWDDKAIWFVTECQHTLEIDHRHPNAGNFVLSRGKDDVIVDPTPYGSQSTLTSNAPTVASGQLPANYLPSQGFWSEHTGYRWATQTRSGVIATRCDYTDQYKFQDRKTDISHASRDLVVLPSAEGTEASIVVIDRASTGNPARNMFLRFRVPSGISLDGETGTSTVGSSKLQIAAPLRNSGKAFVGLPKEKDCFKGQPRGNCDAARFPVTDYRVELAGPEPLAVHVVSATANGSATATKLEGEGWSGIRLAGPRDAVVVWPAKRGGKLAYRTVRGKSVTHVVLDAPDHDGKLTITAKAEGADCVVEVTAGGTTSASPAIATLDDACTVAVDPEGASAAA
ncbi:MAG: hypothetical protein WKG01_17690, partial [Kofleriaceae bacterium]